MAATAGSPVSHKYTVTTGSKTYISLPNMLAYQFSDGATSEEFYLHQISLARKCPRACLCAVFVHRPLDRRRC